MMLLPKIPLSYSIRSIRARFTSTIVAILGIAGVVAVFLAMLAMAEGFRSAMTSSGSPDNVMVRRVGAGSEMESVVMLSEYRILQDLPEVAMNSSGSPLVTGEVVVVIPLVQKATGTEANVQMRGVSGDPFGVRPHIQLTQGRFFEPGQSELLIGSVAANNYEGTMLGNRISIGGRSWEVVGIFNAEGSSFDSEVWADAILTNETFSRPTNIYQSMTMTLREGVDRKALRAQIESDPRLNVTIQDEREYYAERSEMLANLITTLGYLIVTVMGFGAVFAALNTMSSTISARYREIATLRAIGFRRSSIVVCFVLESVLIALLGGAVGCLLALPLNGYQASTMNWDTFSHLGFALKLTPQMMLLGIAFAAIMGFLGGLIPATHASRKSIVNTLRGL